MKSKIYLICICLFLLTGGCSPSLRDENIPVGIARVFKTRYPEAKDISWKAGDSGKFEVHFFMKNEKFSSIFSSDASWILTEKKIKTGELPATVINTIRNGFEDFNIKSVREVESASVGKYYFIFIKSGTKQHYLKLSDNGVILNYNDLKRDID